MCNCKGNNCKCGAFNTGKSFAKSVGQSYVNSEKSKTGKTVTPIGRRGGKPVGKR